MSRLIFIQDLKEYADERKEQGYLKCYFSNPKLKELYKQGYFETDIAHTVENISFLNNVTYYFDSSHNLFSILADIFHKKQSYDEDL